jgi:hypothetical protein
MIISRQSIVSRPLPSRAPVLSGVEKRTAHLRLVVYLGHITLGWGDGVISSLTA